MTPTLTPTPPPVFPLSEAGFSPESWGPHAWKFIHMVAAAYPVTPTIQDKHMYRTFFESLGKVLPCPGCQVGYARLASESLTQAVFADRMSLFKWTVEMHNAVNAKLGKRVDTDVLKWYATYDALRYV
jgi:mitochondrial FAD-linked sulfhydryl oxidase